MPRIHVPTFAEDNEGNLYIARGDRNVQFWDGLAASWRDAGLTGPTNAVTMGTTGTGLITGNLYAYQRFVDADGRVSNLSPISSELVIAGATKTVSGATNASPIVITTSTTHGFSTSNKVKISGIIGNRAANGTWTITVLTTTTFSLDNSAGTGAYVGGGTVRQGTVQIDYSNLGDASSDTRIAKRQILRNKDGDANVFYVDVELTNLATTSASSTKVESQLGTAVVLLDANGNDLNVARHYEPPNYKKVIIHARGRLFSAVDAPYKQGGVAVTNGSPTVTGLGTAFTSAMAGWELFVNGDATTSYTVSSLNTSTQVLTLDTNYGGTTDPYATYSLRPARSATRLSSLEERRTIYFSPVGLPQSVDLLRAITLSEDDEAGEMVGMMAIQTRVYLLFENRIYRLAYSITPEDGESVVASWRGAVNQQSWVIVEDSAYILDRQGVYIFAGNYYEPISEAIQPFFERDNEFRSINWNHTEHFHASHDPHTETIRFFVCMGSHRYPHHALRLHYRTKQWELEEFPFPVTAAALGSLSKTQQLFFATTARRVQAAGRGHLDGIDSTTTATLTGTVTSSDIISLSDSSATFSSDFVGYPVQIISGTGAGQMRIISAVTSTKLTMVNEWSTKPDTTSQYQVGGIRWKYRTGWFRFGQNNMNEPRGFEMLIKPTTAAARLAMRRYVDQSSTAYTEASSVTSAKGNGITITKDSTDLVFDTTRSTGLFRHNADSFRSSDFEGILHIRYELEGVTNGEGQQVRGLVLHGVLQ